MDEILKKIKSDGFRVTNIRLALVRIMFKAKKPLASSDIRHRLSLLGIKADRITVYRSLLFLLERKVIIKIRFSDHKMRYEICAGHCHHLVCTRCKNVKKIVLGKHLESQEIKIYQKEDFKVTSHSLEFYGLCGNCR